MNDTRVSEYARETVIMMMSWNNDNDVTEFKVPLHYSPRSDQVRERNLLDALANEHVGQIV